MYRSSEQFNLIELTREFPRSCQVSFDSDTAALEGHYTDELSAHRARKIWIETLETNFLLENQHDFVIKIAGSAADASFVVKCEFTTACGRYGFWRLTNDQAPEAQYIIETAHIPNAESLYDSFLSAPDLHSQNTVHVSEIEREFAKHLAKQTFGSWVRSIFSNNTK